MKRSDYLNRAALALLALCAAGGCGTTKWSDSPRTATEQLLISDAVDRAISAIDFGPLADKDVYLDTRYIVTALDQNYVISTLRQHMLASGCIIKDKPEDADYVVEVRSGALGTNRQDLLFGIPATNLPTVGLLPMGTASIPEIALMKRTNQAAVCKIAVYAYHRMSGRPVWQSGNREIASRAKDSWFLGAGPFQRGSIYDGTAFAGEKLRVPLIGRKDPPRQASVGIEKQFANPAPQYARQPGYPSGPAYTATLPKDGTPLPPTSPPNGGAKPTGASAPKPAYTPPPRSNSPPPVQPTPGLQGNLKATPVKTLVNPATTTVGAIQTYNWAKDLLGREEE